MTTAVPPVRIGVLVGSRRPTRRGMTVAEWITADPPTGIEFTILDLDTTALPSLAEPDPPMFGTYTLEHTRDWSRLVDGFDGYVLVTPESLAAASWTLLVAQQRPRGGEATVTVVAPQPNMTYQPFLAEAAAGSVEARHVVVPLRRVLPRTRVLAGTPTGPDHAARVATVTSPDGEITELGYDQLVIAVGSEHDIRRYPGLDPEQMRWVLVEAASRILPEVSASLARYTVQGLTERRMHVRLGTRVESMLDGQVILSDGERFESDTIVWTAGVRPNPVAGQLGLPTDDKGRLEVTAELKLNGVPGVWSAG